MNHIEHAKKTFETEIESLENLKNNIDEASFNKACDTILKNQGRVIVIGMGKSGLIGKKIAATLASTGTPAFFVHPGEAGHGDFGMITDKDVVITISNSGNSSEIMAIMPMIKHLAIPNICITSNLNSSMAKASDIVLDLKVTAEACPHNLAPTSSTTATLVIGDALAIALLKARNFTAKDFAFSHPSGALGKRLILKVADVMRVGNEIPINKSSDTIRQAILVMSKKSTGSTFITDDNGKMLGIFTDGDLRRLFEREELNSRDSISTVMHKTPKTVSAETMAIDALVKMEEYEITSLAVLNNDGNVEGIVTMHDLIKLGIK